MFKTRIRIRAALAALLCLGACGAANAQSPTKTQNVVIIVTDGLRWQEVFQGAECDLLDGRQGGVSNPARMDKLFWRNKVEDRRHALLPFFWSVIAEKGQLYGNREKGCTAQVTNGLKFSYPGYNEMLTGAADPRIDSNDFGPNPNATLFEKLNQLPEFRGRVAAFATWDAFGAIFNSARSGLPVQAGWEFHAAENAPSQQKQLADLYRTTTRLWEDNAYDSLMHASVKEYLRDHRPRVLFVGYGETDEWAHLGRYDLLLQSAHQVDAYIAELWNLMQAMPEYRDSTTFIITTDHGRGGGMRKWKNHGHEVDGAENIWIASLGPDTPALGERADCTPVTQNQIAATVAALLGVDIHTLLPKAAPPIADLIKQKN